MVQKAGSFSLHSRVANLKSAEFWGASEVFLHDQVVNGS
jgi:hypothetical protein